MNSLPGLSVQGARILSWKSGFKFQSNKELLLSFKANRLPCLQPVLSLKIEEKNNIFKRWQAG